MILNAFVLTAAILFQQATLAQPENAVAGRVTYGDGTPTPYTRSIVVEQLMGEAGSREDVTPLMAFTGATGDFRFGKIPPGRYVIRTGDSAAYYPGVPTPAAATDATNARLVLSDAATFSTFEQPIGSGGSFAFSSLPQGAYVPSVVGMESSSKAGLLSPSVINVNGVDASGIEIAIPGGNSVQNRQPDIADPSVGAHVSESGGTNRTTIREASAVATLRTINTAEVTYLSISQGNFGTMSQMIDAKLLPETFRGTVNGFNFGLINVGSDFVVAAIPNDSGSARYGFYVTPDGVVRYSTIDALAPTGRNGSPVQ